VASRDLLARVLAGLLLVLLLLALPRVELPSLAPEGPRELRDEEACERVRRSLEVMVRELYR